MRGIPMSYFEVRHVVKRRVSGAKFEEIVMREKKRSKQDFFEPQHFVSSIANRCQANGFRCRRSGLLFVTSTEGMRGHTCTNSLDTCKSFEGIINSSYERYNTKLQYPFSFVI